MARARSHLHGKRFVSTRISALTALAACSLLLAPSTGNATAADEADRAPSAELSPAKASRPAREIEVADIGVESERTKRILADSLHDIRPDGTIETIILAMPNLKLQINELLLNSERIQSRSVTVLELDRLASSWTPLGKELANFQGRLDRRVRRVDRVLETIREQHGLWASTRSDLESQDVSQEVILQIDQVAEAMAKAKARADTEQAAGVRLQSNVANLSQLIESDLERISESREEAVGRVFSHDSDPIWSSKFWTVLDSEQIAKNLSSLGSNFSDGITRLWLEEANRFFSYLTLAFVLILSMFFVRGRINLWLEAEEDAEVIRQIFSRPIALGLLLSFVFALPIFADSLRSLEYALAAIAVIPAVLILRKIVEPQFYSILNIALVVYFLENLRAISVDFSVLSRALFLTELVFLVLSAWRWTQPRRLEGITWTDHQGPAFQVLTYGLRAILALSAIALLANAIGFTFLSQLLGTAIAFGIYAAVVLYGSFRILGACAAIAMNVHPLARLGMVRRNKSLLRSRIRLVLGVLACGLWIRAVLLRLELWPGLSRTWDALLSTQIPLPQISITVGDILTSVLVFYGAVLLSRFIQFMLSEDIYPRLGTRTGRSSAISTLLHYVVLILGFFLAAIALGFDANRFTLLAGAFGVGIGFGLQTIVNNFISGIILLTEQPVQVGDTIEMGTVFGEVRRIGIRSSTVRTFQGSEVIVPNADLIALQVTNWTLSDRKRRIEIPVGVTYGADPDHVLEVLSRIAEDEPGILPEPKAQGLFRGFGESSLDFELRAWTDDFDRFLVLKSKLCAKIVTSFRVEGIQIPFPQRDLHLRSVVSATPIPQEPSRDPA
ncbi:MAG TPA: mechanosensitive ion channel [Myxococcales bacterium]|nr:mechanosensitive ion channel [Myxococcales bacterium]